jgi:phosphoglycolate phosphatase-like HAD superfamily hydrolase
LNYFDLEPYQMIYIGDSQVDEMAARSAAIPLVAFRNRQLSADYHIDTLKELEELLDL